MRKYEKLMEKEKIVKWSIEIRWKFIPPRKKFLRQLAIKYRVAKNIRSYEIRKKKLKKKNTSLSFFHIHIDNKHSLRSLSFLQFAFSFLLFYIVQPVYAAADEWNPLFY